MRLTHSVQFYQVVIGSNHHYLWLKMSHTVKVLLNLIMFYSYIRRHYTPGFFLFFFFLVFILFSGSVGRVYSQGDKMQTGLMAGSRLCLFGGHWMRNLEAVVEKKMALYTANDSWLKFCKDGWVDGWTDGWMGGYAHESSASLGWRWRLTSASHWYQTGLMWYLFSSPSQSLPLSSSPSLCGNSLTQFAPPPGSSSSSRVIFTY